MTTHTTRMLILGSGPAGLSAAIYGARAGMAPHVVTQPGFAWSEGAEPEVRTGIPHHRLPPWPARASLDERLSWYLEAAAPVVEQVRPAVLHAASDYVNALVALELGRRYGLPCDLDAYGLDQRPLRYRRSRPRS